MVDGYGINGVLVGFVVMGAGKGLMGYCDYR